MKVFTTQAWSEVEQKYRRLLLAVWIMLVLGAFLLLATAETTIIGYTLEELTTHSSTGLILKNYALPGREEYRLFISYMIAFSVAIALTSGVLSRLVLAHWRLWVLLLAMVALPATIGAAMLIFWSNEAPELFEWGMRQVLILASSQALAALVGTLLGRPVARLLVKAFVPPRWRGVASVLWAGEAPASSPTHRPAYWSDYVGPSRKS